MKKLHDIAVFMWEWYVVRAWQSLFPPKDAPGDQPPEA